MATQDEPNQTDPEGIPILQSISPAIFVPTDIDFTKPSPPISDDPITRLEVKMEALDWHAAGVEENMIAMFMREAERMRRAGKVERVQYDINRRPIKEPPGETEIDLRLEQMIMRADDEAVLKILKEGPLRPPEDAGQGSRPHHKPQSPAVPQTWRDQRGPEHVDMAYIRSQRMFKTEVDELRQTPRSVALTHVLNLVKWGWDEQLEGHRGAVRREKEECRAKLEYQLRGIAFPTASTETFGLPVPAPAQAISLPIAQMSLIDVEMLDCDDAMELDE
ncbi:hypothetical protein F4808DRAFT_409792 [Astrocystis sublimbata]|nr:hypothetical protein F4808DRAFT_409792 [Astrocystis sublimbata]